MVRDKHGQDLMTQAQTFYGNRANRCIVDYLRGNARLTAAIQHALRWIPRGSHVILDLGCGIGWSSHELARACPEHRITGLDLSPTLIALANKLFTRENLLFCQGDLTDAYDLGEVWREAYDMLVLLDVYEHIPKSDRKEFYLLLDRLLKKEEGLIILSLPSISHQNWLRKNHPEQLQPVDEDVSLQDLFDVAEHLGGEVLFWEYQTIWRPFDYVHAVIGRNLSTGLSSTLTKKTLTVSLEKKWRRAFRVRSRLGKGKANFSLVWKNWLRGR